jgi:GT2 family glycosyltransferase
MSRIENRVALLVLNYRGADDTLACLAAVGQLDPAPTQVIVIDNGSDDGSVERLRAVHPALDLRCNPRNLGYGAGQNAVLAELLDDGFDWIWLLNNDARPRPGALGRMLDAAAGDAQIGAVGARLLDAEPPHRLQTLGGGHVHWWRGRSREWNHDQAPSPDLDYLTGASLLLRCDALRQVGLFDERFFLYWEDVDLCLRLKQAGWVLAVAADAEVLHRQSASTGEGSAAKDRLINATAVKFFRKHGPLGGWPAILIGTAGRVGKRLLSGRFRQAAAVLRGVVGDGK